MVKNFNEKLIELLKKDKRFLTNDGDLIKGEVIKRAYQIDNNLIELLISEKDIKDFFFKKIKDLYVFDINKFVDFVQDKNFLDNSYTKFTQKIQLTISGKSLDEREETALAWGFKDCILEGGMTKEDQKRKEIFFNEVLAKDEIDRLLDEKVLTNFKRYTKEGEEKVKEIKRGDNGVVKENLIIKGNNLLTLHTLKSQFVGQVKLIYIDPPFNTENDGFSYNDNFNHSTWLTFMKNRLEVAKEFLKNEGVIWVHLDDNEVHYAKIILDEIFGRENFLSSIAYQRSGAAGLGQGGKFVVNTTEYILVYAKDRKSFNAIIMEGGVPLDIKHMKRYKGILQNPGNRKLVKEFQSKSTGEKVKIYQHQNYEISTISLANFKKRKEEIKQEYLNNFDKIFRLNVPQEENKFQHKLISEFKDEGLYSVDYLVSRGRHKGEMVTNYYFKKQLFAWLKSSGKIDGDEIIKTNKLTDFWTHAEIPKADLANEGGVRLLRGKKPEQLLRRIIEISTEKGEIILDYHVGCGTTCAVAHKMGRQYIGIEQLDYGENNSWIRLKNVLNGEQSGISKAVNWKGGEDFIYCELMKYNEEAIEKIQKAKDTKELLKIWDELCEKYFLNYDVDIKKFNDNKKDFEQLSLEKQKKLLISMLDKNQLYVNLSEINDKQYKISEEDKKLNNLFYK